MNLYLIVSDSFHIINDEILKITKNNENVVRYNYEEIQIKDILEETSYNSLFDEKKYIIIDNANFFGKENLNEDDEKELEKYINNSNNNNILIFVSTKEINEKKKIVKLFKEKAIVIPRINMNNSELINYIDTFLKANNKNISFKNINYIIECCDKNLDLIINELNKILLYMEKDTIDDEDIINIVSKNNNFSSFDFSDAVLAKNINKAFDIFEVLKTNKEEPSLIVGLLASQYRLVYTVKYLISKKYTNNQIIEELKLHPYRISVAIKQSAMYGLNDLLEKLLELQKIDINIKKNYFDGYNALEMFILNLKDTI